MVADLKLQMKKEQRMKEKKKQDYVDLANMMHTENIRNKEMKD